MIPCRCGHGRHTHRRAQRLSGWERGRGRTGPKPGAWQPCQARVRDELAISTIPVWRTCPCRNYHPQEQPR